MKTNIYLDTRSEDAFGNCPIKISVSHKTRTFYINTGMRAPRAYWDNKARCVNMRYRNATYLNASIARIKASVDSVILRMQLDGSIASMRLDKLRDVIACEVDPKPLVVECGEFLRCFDEFVAKKNKANTRQTYYSTRSRIKNYAKDANSLTFSDIDYKWLDGFYSWLKDNGCPSVNARSIHLRNIRAVFNYAACIDLTTSYPFRKFRIKSGSTTHRALSISDLSKLWNCETATAAEAYALDIWKLSFALIGINMADLYSLSKPTSGILSYKREKTGRIYEIEEQGIAEELSRRHSGRSLYIDASERYANVHAFTIAINKHIKSICERIGIQVVTTYWARHTWATIAASLDIPKDTIAEALGHSQRSVTDIYIQFDKRKINEANRAVLSRVIMGEL